MDFCCSSCAGSCWPLRDQLRSTGLSGYAVATQCRQCSRSTDLDLSPIEAIRKEHSILSLRQERRAGPLFGQHCEQHAEHTTITSRPALCLPGRIVRQTTDWLKRSANTLPEFGIQTRTSKNFWSTIWGCQNDSRSFPDKKVSTLRMPEIIAVQIKFQKRTG